MVVDINILKDEIVSRLKPLDLDKIILFGSYARGTQNEESDIDLFLFKDIERDEVRTLKKDARRSLRDLVFEYHLGFDILVAPESFVLKQTDYFHQKDVLQEGQIIYAR